jgi:hypothetical protein
MVKNSSSGTDETLNVSQADKLTGTIAEFLADQRAKRGANFIYSDARFWPKLCKNAGTILKSALLRKICQCMVNQQT